MGEIDNFLQGIENQYQQKKVNNNPSKENKTPDKKNDIDAFLSHIESEKKVHHNKGIEDDLVSEIETKFQQKQSRHSPLQNHHTNNDLLSEIESQFTQQKSQTKSDSHNLLSDIEKQYQAEKVTHPSPSKSNIAENYIADIVTNYHQKQKAIISDKKSHNLEEIKQQELEKQRQEKLLTRKAEAWLKNLDPYSDEGFWFEQFALSYPSKLEAAIDYLKALTSS